MTSGKSSGGGKRPGSGPKVKIGGKPRQADMHPAEPPKSEAAGPAAAEASGLQQTLDLLTGRIDRLAHDMEKAQLREYVNLMRRPWSLMWRSFVSGLTRGIGTALGFTFFAATIVWILQILGALNLPIIGDYIADIVRIVQRQLEIKTY